MKKFISFFLLLTISAVQAVEIETLVKKSDYHNVKISPDGKHLAVKSYNGEKYGLVILDINTFEKVGSLFIKGEDQVGQYFWGNNERLVMQLSRISPWEKKPQNRGELYAVNLDGSKPELIFGYRAAKNKNNYKKVKKKQSTYGWARPIDGLPDDPNHILIASTKRDRLAVPMLLNIYTGYLQKSFAKVPTPNAQILTNAQGELAFASAMDENEQKRNYRYDSENNQWQEITAKKFGREFFPLAVTDNGESVYVLDNQESDTRGLYKLKLDGSTYTKIHVNDKVDISGLEKTTDGRHIYAMKFDNGLPEYALLTSQFEEARVFKSLIQKFPGYKINITSSTRDGKKLIVNVSSDTKAGLFLLLDQEANTQTFLFSKKPHLKGQKLASMKPISFVNSDNMTINGYFTKSLSDSENMPLVVMVHGGPHGARNYWGYSTPVQALATNGISVLQVNFRGSNGYGKAFKEAGYKRWGDKIQQDIIEATQWAIEQGYGNKDNICIMGASFGGYSAVQSATIAPDLFQCAVATAGVYDLNLLDEKGDVKSLYFASSLFERILGTDENALAAMSPVNYANKIKAPLLLVHGEKDKRAPIIHAEKLMEALDKYNKSYQWLKIDDEAHGFYDSENQQLFLDTSIKFLNKHLEL